MQANTAALRYRPQFGKQANTTITLTAPQWCEELQQVNQRFHQMTQRSLDSLWRAPGGKTSPNALKLSQQCNPSFKHVGWAKAGFLGDELPSHSYPNQQLVKQAVARLQAGDIVMAHLGIWSRQDPFAPMFDGLITQLKAKGFCFLPLTEHPNLHSSSPTL
jgi:peptidoglycan/xylan/chitin deacetylase (PgdA/CDA1 family)